MFPGSKKRTSARLWFTITFYSVQAYLS
jgi:hypothetical protein